MKKITSYLVYAVMEVMMLACGNNNSNNEIQFDDDSELRDIVYEINKTCPVSAGDYITIEGFEYADHEVTITYLIKNGALDINAIRANEKTYHNNMLVSFANNSDKDFKKMIDLIIRADAGMNLMFSDGNGDSYTLHFTATELKENRPDDNADPEKLLKSMADNTRLQTPMVIEEGVVMTDINLDDNYFTYIYSCDESLIDMDVLKKNSAKMKEMILENASNMNDLTITQQCNLLRKTNRKFAYKYVGSSTGKVCTIYVSPDEL